MLTCELDRLITLFNKNTSDRLNDVYPDISVSWGRDYKEHAEQRPLVGAVREEDGAPLENVGVVLVVGINFGQFKTSQDYIKKSSLDNVEL